MTKDRRILFILLITLIFISLTLIIFFIQSGKREQILERTGLIENMFVKINKDLNALSIEDYNYIKELVEEEKRRFLDRVDYDPYRLAIDIKQMLHDDNLKVMNYRTGDFCDQYVVEFSITGSSIDLFSFLEKLYRRDLYYIIPSFSIKNEKVGISVIFTIGYSVYEKKA